MPTSACNALHIAVDVLDVYVNGLCPERRDIADRITSFAQSVASVAPTLWVSNCLRPDDLRPVADMDDAAVAERLRQYRLLCAPVSKNDYFVNKNERSLLSNRQADALIAAIAPREIFITGLNTTACVAATIADLLRDGQKVVVVTDCLGDSGYEQFVPLSPDQHRDRLLNLVEAQLMNAELAQEQNRRDRDPRAYPGLSRVTFGDVLPRVVAHMARLRPIEHCPARSPTTHSPATPRPTFPAL